MEWVWTDDPLNEPDEDHARCIAAPGRRALEACGHTFVLTTHQCPPGTALEDGRTPLSCWQLYLECTELGCSFSSGATSLSWRSAPFISPSVFSLTAREAGRLLFEAAERDLQVAALC